MNCLVLKYKSPHHIIYADSINFKNLSLGRLTRIDKLSGTLKKIAGNVQSYPEN